MSVYPHDREHVMGRPATGITRGRNVRVPDHIWEPAMARAQAEGTTLSAEINAFLRRYGKNYAGERVTSDAVSTESASDGRQ